MPRAIRGLDAYLYVSNDDGTTWIECGSARDVTVDISAAEIDVSRRGSVWRQNLAGLKEFSISGTMIKDDTDQGYLACEAAALASTAILLMALDGDRETSASPVAKGYKSKCVFTEWSEDQALEEGIVINFTASNHPDDDPAAVTGPIPPPT